MYCICACDWAFLKSKRITGRSSASAQQQQILKGKWGRWVWHVPRRTGAHNKIYDTVLLDLHPCKRLKSRISVHVNLFKCNTLFQIHGHLCLMKNINVLSRSAQAFKWVAATLAWLQEATDLSADLIEDAPLVLPFTQPGEATEAKKICWMRGEQILFAQSIVRCIPHCSPSA